MNSPEFPLVFAAHKSKIQKQLPNFKIEFLDKYFIIYNNVYIYEMQGDCGCIYITSTHYLTDKICKDIENFAALNGYTKILCTLSEEFMGMQLTKDLLVKNGFTFIDTGLSNRSSILHDEEDIPLYNLQTWLGFKIITPKKQGYV